MKQAAAAISDAMARCGAGERVAVLDLRPGRTASWTYRRAMAQWKNGTYLTPPHTLGGNLAVEPGRGENGAQLWGSRCWMAGALRAT